MDPNIITLPDGNTIDLNPVIQDVPDDEEVLVAPPKPPKEFLNGGELDEKTARLMRMQQVIGKFASTLTLKPIGIELLNPHDAGCQEAPAWSDSDNIWFNKASLGDITLPENITSLKGLSLHEIAHILLTPRAGSNLAKDVQKAKMWRAFNALEDQRIEMMMTKRFGNVADWLTATISQHLVKDVSQHSVAFPLLHGRKYLPKELLRQVRSMYEQQHNVAELSDLIDRYIVLNLADPKNYKTAFDIIKRYHELVGELESQNPEQYWLPQGGFDRINDPNGHHKRKGGEWKASKSKIMSKDEQAKMADRIAKELAQQQAQGMGAPSDEQGDSSGDNGSGAGESGSDLTDIAQRVFDDVLKHKAKEIANIAKQYDADIELSSKSVDAPPRMRTANVPVPADVVQASRSFANELSRLKADYDPGWIRNVDQGRLSVERYSRGADIEECFDEWDMGREDAVDIECVILLDVSPSMGDAVNGAYESMWAIKRAMDKVNAATTVIAFSHVSHLLYAADERAGNSLKHGGRGGGTAPLDSLKYAKYLLAESDRAIKIVVAITDGTWSDTKECDDILRQLRRGGVLTALAYVETDSWWGGQSLIDSHGCEVAVNLTNTSDLFDLGRRMVQVGVARNLVR